MPWARPPAELVPAGQSRTGSRLASRAAALRRHRLLAYGQQKQCTWVWVGGAATVHGVSLGPCAAAGGTRALSGAPPMRTLVPLARAPPSWPCHLPIPWEVLSTHGFGGHRHSRWPLASLPPLAPRAAAFTCGALQPLSSLGL